ncbi:MAG TPA: polysaccharide deacetylase family protein [Terriglobales bacterium]|nr:polysaccharide deacetylase family protein [Terriglobales bacterium]
MHDAVLQLLGLPPQARCVALYYHSVSCSQRTKFARQMDILNRWTKAIRADRRAALQAGKRYSIVTFDDAFESVFRNALPELEKRGIPATVFVIAGVMGRTTGWEGYPERTMTPDEIKGMRSDLVMIGSHTLNHSPLCSLSEPEVKTEISESRKRLEELLHRKITLFSFPYGGFRDYMIEWCKEAGYERVFTTLPYLALSDPQEFLTGRISVEPDDWLLEFRLKLLGAYRWLPCAFSLKRRLFPIEDSDKRYSPREHEVLTDHVESRVN